MRTALLGLGSVHLQLLQILAQKQQVLNDDYRLEFDIIAAADSSGIVVDEAGLSARDLASLKRSGTCMASMAHASDACETAAVLAQVDFDLLFEATPFDLEHGEPGLSYVRAALGSGKSTVLANKGPLVAAFHELTDLARVKHAGLAYSATVCGGLPVMNIALRDMPASSFLSLRGVFNSTSNFVLENMGQGRAYEASLAEAQQRGIAEADPSLDVGGWDTAAKLLIIANTLLGHRYTLNEIGVTGIEQLTVSQVQRERRRGRVMRLVAQADEAGLRVAPIALHREDFLASCRGWEMGVEIHNDLFGRSFHKLYEREPLPTAASMLRDAIHLCGA